MRMNINHSSGLYIIHVTIEDVTSTYTTDYILSLQIFTFASLSSEMKQKES